MKKGNILIVTQWGYEEGLIQSYTLPYLRIIHKIIPQSKIFLITQEKSGLQDDKAKLALIRKNLKRENIFLIEEKYYRAGFVKYLHSLSRFLFHLYIVIFKRIEFIHSFCSPAGAYAYIISRFARRKLIIDSYEPHSEYMREASVWDGDGFLYKALSILEKKQALAADHLIAATPHTISFAEKKYDIQLPVYHVKPACVDLSVFYYNGTVAKTRRTQLGWADKIVAVYAGKFGDFYLKEEVFEFLKECFKYWESRFHVLLLSDLKESDLKSYCEKYHLPFESFTLLMIPHKEVPLFLSLADFAMAAYKPTPSKKYCTPIKNGEYWATGLPVVIPAGISVDSEIIESNNIGYVIKELNQEEYRKAVAKLNELFSGDREVLRNKIRKIAEENRSFSLAENIYMQIYKN